MTLYLGLGSNEGDRKTNLGNAIHRLESEGFRIARISPVVETPALLPDGADPEWNKPYLNCVVSGEAGWTPAEGLYRVKSIETDMGRRSGERWSPRIMDIDILLWHDQTVHTADLVIPHAGILERPFVLTPLLHLQPDLIIPGQQKTVFQLSENLAPVPLWMGVLNITPDSFSGGGEWTDPRVLEQHLESLVSENVQILDIGAESTRPRASQIDSREEWGRLQPVLERVQEQLGNHPVRPLISLDSRHADTIEKSFRYGVSMVNDVSGLTSREIISVVRNVKCDVVAMHSVSVPADPRKLLPVDRGAVMQMTDWLDRKIEGWLSLGLDLNRIIVDPGIGFGKTALQSMELLQHCQVLRSRGLRLLIGHSRKSFMNSFSTSTFSDRDLETLGVSLSLCQQGVDILRVHDPVMHVRAYRAWSHIAT